MDFNEAKAWFAAMLDSGLTPELNAWIDSVLGGEWKHPARKYVTVPSCRGLATYACKSALSSAGLTGTVTTVTLPSQAAVPGVAASWPTGTQPAAGLRVPSDRPIQMFINPNPMPAKKAERVSAAQALMTRNGPTLSANGYDSTGRSRSWTGA